MNQRLCRHSVGIVNDYADTSMTSQTLFEYFEGFLQILKEQSGKKGIWVCLSGHGVSIVNNYMHTQFSKI